MFRYGEWLARALEDAGGLTPTNVGISATFLAHIQVIVLRTYIWLTIHHSVVDLRFGGCGPRSILTEGFMNTTVSSSRRYHWNFYAFVVDYAAYMIGLRFVNSTSVLPTLVSELTDPAFLIGLVNTVFEGSHRCRLSCWKIHRLWLYATRCYTQLSTSTQAEYSYDKKH